MLSHPNLTIELINCSEDERALLEEYWNCDSNAVFSVPLKDLSKKYKLGIDQIYRIASQKSEVHWNFGDCECGNRITTRLTKRKELASCLTESGVINTYKSFLDFKKCSECYDKEEQEFFDRQFNNNNFEGALSQNNINSNGIDTIIKSLSSIEIKILYKIYDLRDFNLIKNSSDIFPVRAGEYKRFVWRTLYKLDSLNLISTEKKGSYIKTIIFFDEVESILNQMIGELETYIEETDIELAMLKVSDQSKDKYFTVFEPETDIVLKAGNKYEFISRIISDKNMLLRVINLNKGSDTLKFEDSDASSDCSSLSVPPPILKNEEYSNTINNDAGFEL